MSAIQRCECRLPECPEHAGDCDGLDAYEMFGPKMTFCCSRCARFRRKVASGQLPLRAEGGPA